MYIVLRGSTNGCLVAQRLRQAGLPFLILDRAGQLLSSGNDQAFFYAHTDTPFNLPDTFPIRTSSCPGTAQDYKQKVYGDRPLHKHSLSFQRYATAVENRQGYLYNPSKLTTGLEPRQGSLYSIDSRRRILYTLEGKTFRYKTLLSTMPLPELLSCIDENFWPHNKPVKLKLNSQAIGLEQLSVIESRDRDVMEVHYCPGSCHPWYRQTVHFVKGASSARARREHIVEDESKLILHDTSSSYRFMKPGKIWFGSQAEEEEIIDIRNRLQVYGIYVFGRYGAWEPKGLTGHTWEQICELIKA